MHLFLTSHMGGIRETENGDFPAVLLQENGFLDRLRTRWPENARVMQIASDPDSPEALNKYAQISLAAIRLSGLSAQGITPLDNRNPEEAENLHRYDVLILSGGHVPTQNAFFHKIGLKEKIASFKGIVIGISAGTMNCASTVYAHPELDGEAVDPDYQRYLPGLGLTELQILPHFQYLRTITLDGMKAIDQIAAADSRGRSFLCLNDGAYALVENGQTTVYGEAYTLKDSVLTQICRDGESLLL